ncbi:hypothetical protein ABFT23_13865 [Nocardioides sp. C4-1]|uniref:hypothetical protein n=1 Tax=Nocardioides sp. C4-1 TaxID=3151851 RepID=UPI00326537F7
MPSDHPEPLPSAIVEPVPRDLQALLRRAVLGLARETRRSFPPVVHVGVPGARVARLELGDQRLDHALRADAVLAMVRRTRQPGPGALLWLTRPGTPEVRDVDMAWLAAARTASAELAQRLPMAVVTRRAWRDPATGVGREWARMRERPGPGG